MYRVNIRPVDAGRTGPAEYRLVPAGLGLLAGLPDWKLDPAALPNLQTTFEPRKPSESPGVPRLVDMLSQSGTYLSLNVWLPANAEGVGYVLHPQLAIVSLAARRRRASAGRGGAFPALNSPAAM